LKKGFFLSLSQLALATATKRPAGVNKVTIATLIPSLFFPGLPFEQQKHLWRSILI
jgi:hypothetical protein